MAEVREAEHHSGGLAPEEATDLARIESFVRASRAEDEAQTQSRLRALAATGHWAPQVGLFLLAVLGNKPREARGRALNVLRSHPAEIAHLKQFDQSVARESLLAAESIVAAEAEVKRVRQNRNDDTVAATLRKLRTISERAPLCYLAQKEHQRICECKGALQAADDFYLRARDYDEPWPLLGPATARVAVAAGDLKRMLEILLESAGRGTPLSEIGKVVSSALAAFPAWRPGAEAYLEQLATAAGDPSGAQSLLELFGQPQPREQVAAPAATRNVESPAHVVSRIISLGPGALPDALRNARERARQPAKHSTRQLFEYFTLLIAAGDNAAARDLFRELAKRDVQGPHRYAEVARQILEAGSLEALDWLAVSAPQGPPGDAAERPVAVPQDTYSPSPDMVGKLRGARGKTAKVVTRSAIDVIQGLGSTPSAALRGNLSLPVEQRLAETMVSQARGLQRRTKGITLLARLRVHWLSLDTRKGPDWYVKHTFVFVHLLSGDAIPLGKSISDSVALELRQARSGSVGEHLANNFLIGHGPPLWNATVNLGNLGYRLRELPRLGPGHVLLTLETSSTAPGVPARLNFLAVYGDTPETTEGVGKKLASLAQGPPIATVVAVYVGDSALRLQTYESLTNRYGTACVQLESLAGKSLGETLERALALAGTIANPVQAFPFRGQNLRDDQLVRRPDVVASLEAALDGAPMPVAIYCMRKAGKTSTARLLQLANPHEFIDLRRHVGMLSEAPRKLLKLLQDAEPISSDRRGVLVLDEFDLLARQLAEVSEAVAIEYLNWLSDAAQHSRILCLGLDPEPFLSLYPASNPFQELTEFRLRYLDGEECMLLTRRMAGALKLTDDLVEWLFVQSGGHPGVLRGLMLWCIEARFGKNAARIPTSEPLRLADVPVEQLAAESGFAERQRALGTVLNTVGGARGIVRRAWTLMQYLVAHLPRATTQAAILESARTHDLGLGTDTPAVLELLLSWGLLKRAHDGNVSISIPLLRRHLREQQKLGAEA